MGYLIGVGGRDLEDPDATAEEVPAVARGRASSQRLGPVEPVTEEPAARHRRVVSPPVEEPAELPAGGGSRVALVIDDLGRRVQDVRDLAALGVPVTFAVLPYEIRTQAVLQEIEGTGHELLLHLPMQPSSGADPGPGALLTTMSEAELEAATLAALDAVGGALGVNNHMGSELSADAGKMRTILGVLADRDLFFLDSRTSSRSVGYDLALELGMAAARRHVFLDVDPRPEAIRRQFRASLDEARALGAAVAIGHPYAETLAALRELVPSAVAAGYEVVTVRSLTRRLDSRIADRSRGGSGGTDVAVP